MKRKQMFAESRSRIVLAKLFPFFFQAKEKYLKHLKENSIYWTHHEASKCPCSAGADSYVLRI